MSKDFLALNAKINLEKVYNAKNDKEAARQYFLQDINQNTVFFHSLEEKLRYLVEEKYYDDEVLSQYTPEFLKVLWKKAYNYKFRFKTFVGAYKFYTSYAMKTGDGARYLERYEDRVVMNALLLARGDESYAKSILHTIITGAFQPATPTFLNAGKIRRGEYVSCFLMRTEDNMESITRNITNSLQLSKRGGGVAVLLSNLREKGAPIKGVEGCCSGVVPVMKILEDSFSYADQLGARQGAGAVYLHAHHPDILTFLDTKRENADEKIRIKTLSLGIVLPDITFELAKKNEPMYLFSPLDVEKEYGKPLSDVGVTEHYHEMVNNVNIKKYEISARNLFKIIAELQFESGYPYLMFEDTVNKANPVNGYINMSNLCSEILQVNTASTYQSNGMYEETGKDISCNLGSLNVEHTMESGELGEVVDTAIRALTTVSEISDISCVPSIEYGNNTSHAVGLGQMNLHGYFMKQGWSYGDEASLDFTKTYFMTILYHCLQTSNKLAQERGVAFLGFEESKYADGTFFDKYTTRCWKPSTEVVTKVFNEAGISVPNEVDWITLKAKVQEFGIYNQNLQAIPPTGSISYINNATASIHPITKAIEIRKEGKMGRVYYPAPNLTAENQKDYEDAYSIGYERLIDIYAAATEHVDQGLSLTLFLNGDATTRDVNKAQIYAWKKGIKTLYYLRIRQDALSGTEVEESSECESCSV